MTPVRAPVLQDAPPQDQGGVSVRNLLRRDEGPFCELRRHEALPAAVSVEAVQQRVLPEPLHGLVPAGLEGAGQHAEI